MRASCRGTGVVGPRDLAPVGPRRGSRVLQETGSDARRTGMRNAPDESRRLLAELRAAYARIDSALDGWTCDASTDCCRFGVTGREPYPTAIELAELERAVKARGGLPKRRTLP